MQVRPSQVDGERRAFLANLKDRVREKLEDRFHPMSAQWQGYALAGDHLTDMCIEIKRSLSEDIQAEMSRRPRVNFIRQEVTGHLNQQAMILDAVRKRDGELEQGVGPNVDKVKGYLEKKSDNTLKPCLLTGPPGSGISSCLAATYDWGVSSLPRGTVVVYRNLGHTPDSANGCSMLYGMAQQLLAAFKSAGDGELTLEVSFHSQTPSLDLPQF